MIGNFHESEKRLYLYCTGLLMIRYNNLLDITTYIHEEKTFLSILNRDKRNVFCN